jgi:hypothetical protein
MRTMIPIVAIAVTTLIATGTLHAQPGTYTGARKDCGTRAYWPTFGYIPGGPYVYVPPTAAPCRQIRHVDTPRVRRMPDPAIGR